MQEHCRQLFTRHMFSQYHCIPAESRNAKKEVLGSHLFCQMLWVCGITLNVYAGLLLKMGNAPIKYFKSSFMVYLLADIHIVTLHWEFGIHIVISCAQICCFTSYYCREGCLVLSEPKLLPSSLSTEIFSSLFAVASPDHCCHSHQHTLHQDQVRDGDLLQSLRRKSGQMLFLASPAMQIKPSVVTALTRFFSY